MKKIIIYFTLLTTISVGIVSNLIINGQSQESIKAKKAIAVVQPTERARLAYCQIIGDRTGCKNDPTRSCGSSVFCN